MNRVCFVSDEFYPVRPGGIGRVLYNIITSFIEDGLDISILMPRATKAEIEELNVLYRGTVDFWSVNDVPPETFGASFSQVTFRRRFKVDPLYESRQIFLSLLAKQAEIGVKYDVIEFPDFRGWAYSAIQAKRSGLAFDETLLTVRLHSTNSLIDAYEPAYSSSDFNLRCLRVLEREALASADVIISHVRGVERLVSKHFRFPDSWTAKVINQAIPILPLQDVAFRTTSWKQSSLERNLVFSTRLVPFKDVELFLRAASELVTRDVSWRGRVIVACAGWQIEYVEFLKSIVPIEIANRFSFRGTLSEAERQAAIANSVFVIPSRVESCCLAAYEASLAGAIVVINGSCVAFGDESPWVDRLNCFKHKPTTSSLFEVLSLAVRSEPLERVHISPERPYFLAPAVANALMPSPKQRVTLSAIVHVDNNAEYLGALLKELYAIKSCGLEVIIVNDASSGYNDSIISFLSSSAPPGALFKVVTLAAKHGRASSYAEAWESVTGDAVVFLEPGMAVDVTSLAEYGHKLASGDMDVIFSEVGIVSPSAGWRELIFERVIQAATFDSFVLEQVDVVGASSPMVRKGAFESFPLDTKVADFEFLEFMFRAKNSVDLRVCSAPTISIVIMKNGGEEHSLVIERCRRSLLQLGNHLEVSGFSNRFTPTDEVVGSLVNLLPWGARSLPRSFSNGGEETRLSYRSKTIVDGEKLAQFVHLPSDDTESDLPSYQLVVYRPDLGGVLVHPVAGSATVASLNLATLPTSAVIAQVWNANAQNAGIEFSVAVSTPEISIAEANLLLRQGANDSRLRIADWRFVPPDAHDEIVLDFDGITEVAHVYLMTRVPSGLKDHFCHAVFERIEFATR